MQRELSTTPESETKLRILHVARSYDDVGGVERYVRDLVRHQQSTGHQSDTLVVSPDGGLRVTVRTEGERKVFLAPRLFAYQSAVASLRFPDALARIARGYDVLHFHYPNPMGELSLLLVAPLVRAAKIVTFHGEVVPEKSFSRVYSRLARLFFRRMDRIIVTSPQMLETAHLLHGLQNKTKVIPLGIHVPEDAPSTPSPVFPKNADPKILFVGRLSRYKGLIYLIQAMANAPGHLVIVGDGPLGHDLKTQSVQAGLTSRITFTGTLSDEELRKAYRSADLFVLPSIDRAEGFGYVLLEAMAASLPMITTELGTGTSYVNQDGETGIVVVPRNANALAEAIKRLSADPSRMKLFGDAAKKRFLDKFTFDHMAADVEREYRAVTTKLT